MTASIKFARADGDVELFNGTPTTGQTTIAAQTTLVAGTTTLTGGVNFCVPVTGSTAVALPKNAQSPIVVFNNAATAVTLLVFPPWDSVAGAAAGGAIGAGAANASFSVAQGKGAVFYPTTNGVNFAPLLSA